MDKYYIHWLKLGTHWTSRLKNHSKEYVVKRCERSGNVREKHSTCLHTPFLPYWATSKNLNERILQIDCQETK